MNGSRRGVAFPLLAHLWLALVSVSCGVPAGRVQIDFAFDVDGRPLRQDEFCCTNAAGNVYEVTEAQYFISEVAFVRRDGSRVAPAGGSAHYIDADIPSTLVWRPDGELPAGAYAGISFVFGLARDNDCRYTDPPENNMSWPQFLGGGYHYMKINGKWLLPDSTMAPFNLHAGPGQEKDANGHVTGFVDNTFTVTLPLPDGFAVEKDRTSRIRLSMDINRWFDNPFLLDLNVIGGSIMENQEVQEMLRANGKSDVFSIAGRRE